MNELTQTNRTFDIEPVKPPEQRHGFVLAESDSVSAIRYVAVQIKQGLPAHPRPPGGLPEVPLSMRNLKNMAPAVWTSPPAQTESFVALQRWEGRVISCGVETFRAVLSDLTEPGPEEEVELLMEDVPNEDSALVAPGAIFYWSIGYLNEASGGKPRMSTLRFRRLPVWSAAELAAAREPVGPLAEFFGAD
jgi:hypothetical protein